MVEGFKHSVSCQRMMVFHTLRPFGKDCFFAAWGNRATFGIYKKQLGELAKRLEWRRRRTAPLGAGGAEPHYISERQRKSSDTAYLEPKRDTRAWDLGLDAEPPREPYRHGIFIRCFDPIHRACADKLCKKGPRKVLEKWVGHGGARFCTREKQVHRR